MSAALADSTTATPTGPFLLHPEGPPVPSSPDRLHVRVDARHLLTAVRDLEVAIPRRPPVPVLAMIHVLPVPGGVQLTAFDYEVTVRRTIPAVVSSGQPVLMHPAWLRRAALAAGSGTLTLAVRAGGEGDEVLASDGFLRRRVRVTAPVEEFPVVQHLADRPKTLRVGAFPWGLLQHLTTPAFAAAGDETPPVLTALRLRVAGGRVTSVATDRYRLATAYVDAPDAEADVEVMARAGTLTRILGRFGRGENVTVSVDTLTTGQQLLRLDTAGGVATLPVMSGEYPSVDRLWPAREDLHGAVLVDRRAMITMVENIADDDRSPVRLTVDEVLEVASDNGWSATAGRMAPTGDWRHVGHDCAGISTGFNPRYLVEALKSFPHEHVELSYTKPTKPLLIAGVRADEPRSGDHLIRPGWAASVDTTSTHLLMPTRTAGGLDS